MQKNYSKIFTKKEEQINKEPQKEIEQETKKDNYFDSFIEVTTNNLNLRTEPDKRSVILCVLEIGEILNLKETSNGWLKVVTTDNLEGYIIEGHTKKVV